MKKEVEKFLTDNSLKEQISDCINVIKKRKFEVEDFLELIEEENSLQKEELKLYIISTHLTQSEKKLIELKEILYDYQNVLDLNH